ncbi:helix-hairpin-helix domain-containing protein [Sinomicrobium pectinilyticum]|uniref:Helix-hairpin-helix domain-containing protein n=1 Tax=Sinomicrobium pectinilyticum TaxID=1084421 RepID=A0A3N0ECV4_SINP1|nr:helix-hairpin-helix domain-containing protein [Sinomicrobium pectinilyticum]RNL85664.1 helix-hairpin-helix domain-containing protein [Sinomicrobium pectinilyticum]
MKIWSHFRFDKKERSGIFFLLLLILIVQGIYLASGFLFPVKEKEVKEEELNAFRARIDSFRHRERKHDTIYPFNPNYLSDHKAYMLGMNVAEIDRLYAYRQTGGFVRSASEFAEVTGIPDSLLRKIAPYFRFPDFAKKQRSKRPDRSGRAAAQSRAIQDLNRATARDLRSVSGVGEKLSGRIVKYRDLLGGFFLDEQLYEVYGLDSVTVQRIMEQFRVVESPAVEKLDINSASRKDLASLVYLSWEEAGKIIVYRSAVDKIKSIDELRKIEDFPDEKIDRIKLYLTTQ